MSKFGDKPPHIGIIAGTADGAALCYRTLCLEAEKDHRSVHPEITLHSFPLHWYLDAIDRGDWTGVASLLSQSAAKLEHVGADFIVCPNNTLHKAVDLIDSPIPWLHIAQPVVEKVTERQWHRVGILGTQTVMDGAVYAEKFQRAHIEAVLPEQHDRIRIQQIIRSELVAGLFTHTSRVFFQKVVEEMALKGAEAVVLACTELPLLMSGHHTAVPLLDSTRLLAQAALRYKWLEGEHLMKTCMTGPQSLQRVNKYSPCR
jgi:aspartate racemase